MAEKRFDEGDFEELASELRQSVGREFRWEAEDIEHLTEQQRRRSRSMSDVAHEAMSRGDVVALTRQAIQHRGTLVTVAPDLAVLDTGMGLVNAHLPHVLLTVVGLSRSGGTTGDRSARSFRGRVAELEHSGEVVIVEGEGLELRGRVVVAAADHLSVMDPERRQWFIPYAHIWFIIQPRD